MGDNDFLFRKFGAAEFPPDLTARPESLFSAFDPGLDRMLALFKAALNYELSAAWTIAKQGTPLAASDPVADTLWQQPTKATLRQRKADWPLLCLARVSGTHEDLTLHREQHTTTWSLDYLLGPLDTASFRRLGGALNAALKILQEVVAAHGHPSVAGGADQFDGFNTIRIMTDGIGTAGFADDPDGPEYHGLHVDIETTELDKPMDGSVGDYNGATFVFGVGDAHDILPNEIIARTDVPLSPG